MFYVKKGFPEVGEIVICTVKTVLSHAVFVKLDEYDKEGMIHLPEISPGRIRNIRDFVKEGKKIVCKILKKDENRGHIDLSLRRVNQSQRINKNKEYKQEQKAEKILQDTAKSLNLELKEVYDKAGNKMIEQYGGLTPSFYAIINNELNLEEIEVPTKIAQELTKIIKEKIKPIEVTISGILKLRTEDSKGIEIIKKTLNHLKETGNKSLIKITYMGAPKYKISITSKDYKDAEKIIKKVSTSAIDYISKLDGNAEFERL